MAFEPDPPPKLSGQTDAEVLLGYIMRQFQRLGQEAGGDLTAGLPVLKSEPKKKTEFMIVAADGLHWNPGAGKGLYTWYSGAWHPFAVTIDEPTEVPEEPTEPPVEPPPPEDPNDPAGYQLFSSWEEGIPTAAKLGDGTVENNWWGRQSAADDRIQVIDKSTLPGGVGTDGNKLVFFTAKNNDFINSSSWVRSELSLGSGSEAERADRSNGYPGVHQWWAYSLWIPPNYVFPQNRWNNALHGQFHASISGSTQPHWCMEVAIEPEGGQDVAMWRQRIYGGDSPPPRTYPRGRVEVQRGFWYDITIEVKWERDSTGLWRTWMRRRDEAEQALVLEVLNFQTLYNNSNAYFKIGTYHPPYNGGDVGFDRVVRAADAKSVAICPLEGVTL